MTGEHVVRRRQSTRSRTLPSTVRTTPRTPTEDRTTARKRSRPERYTGRLGVMVGSRPTGLGLREGDNDGSGLVDGIGEPEASAEGVGSEAVDDGLGVGDRSVAVPGPDA